MGTSDGIGLNSCFTAVPGFNRNLDTELTETFRADKDYFFYELWRTVVENRNWADRVIGPCHSTQKNPVCWVLGEKSL